MSKIVRNLIIVAVLFIAGTLAFVIPDGVEPLLSWRYLGFVCVAISTALIPLVWSKHGGPAQASQFSTSSAVTKTLAQSGVTLDTNTAAAGYARELLEDSITPVVNLAVNPQPVGIYDCKIGGTPYLPPGFRYPRAKREGDPSAVKSGNPLSLLCQLNFALLPPMEGFPTEGILQFYIANDVSPFSEHGNAYGVDPKNPTVQDSWRVIYHKAPLAAPDTLQSPPTISGKKLHLPFEEELALIPTLSEVTINPKDFRFEELEIGLRDSFPQESHSVADYFETFSYLRVNESLEFPPMDGFGTKVGGYPAFYGEDPRGKRHHEHETLLLQIDSGRYITWGNGGVANFFISPYYLARCDFSYVAFWWDFAY